MDKINFDINQFLRFLIAGGWAVGCFLFMYPQKFENLAKEHTGDLVLIAMVLGSIIYVFHRAIIYPNLNKLMYIILAIFKKMKWSRSYLIPFFPSKSEIERDLDRWTLRKNEKSISKNITTWGSQVHLLYCSAFASLFAIIFSKQIGNYDAEHLLFVRRIFWVLFTAGIIDDFRIFLYDLKIIEREKKLL